MERRKINTGSQMVLKLLVLFLLVFAAAFPMITTVSHAADDTYMVSVSEGYLALRIAKAFDASNEIGRLYSDDLVETVDCSDPTYWYVYAPSLDNYGYVNKDYLISTIGSTWNVRVESGYLALRNAKVFDSSNEIGKLYSGDTVWVYEAGNPDYWYVYSPKLQVYGFVNKDYLYDGSTGASTDTRTVRVENGYLALRTAKAFDSGNEIGCLYTGDTVQLLDTRDSTYWYVYAPSLGRYGYVNCDYLYSSQENVTRSVWVENGYLALRTAKAFDSRNEIGRMYTGDVVRVLDSSDPVYWYVYSLDLDKSGYVNKDYLH